MVLSGEAARKGWTEAADEVPHRYSSRSLSNSYVLSTVCYVCA